MKWLKNNTFQKNNEKIRFQVEIINSGIDREVVEIYLRASFLAAPRAGQGDPAQGAHRHGAVEMPLSLVFLHIAATVHGWEYHEQNPHYLLNYTTVINKSNHPKSSKGSVSLLYVVVLSFAMGFVRAD